MPERGLRFLDDAGSERSKFTTGPGAIASAALPKGPFSTEIRRSHASPDFPIDCATCPLRRALVAQLNVQKFSTAWAAWSNMLSSAIAP